MLWRSSIQEAEESGNVKIVYGSVVDETRAGREIPYKVYVPASGASYTFPVVLWSHGLGGSRDGAGFLARYVASHGYAVIHLTHIGSDTSIWEGKQGHPWDVIRATRIPRRTTLHRFRDVSAFVDRLPGVEAAHAEIAGRIDRSRIGMSGHSFGALTTQIMAGQKLGRGRRLYGLRDKRFRAGIAYSMTATYNEGEDPAAIYGPIAMPMLYMTGTADDSPVTGSGYETRLPIFENARGPDQHLLVLDGADHMVFAGSRGKLAAYEKMRRHREIIQTLSLCYWDAYLKEDEQAFEWLTGDGCLNYLGMDGEYVFRPNGKADLKP